MLAHPRRPRRSPPAAHVPSACSPTPTSSTVTPTSSRPAVGRTNTPGAYSWSGIRRGCGGSPVSRDSTPPPPRTPSSSAGPRPIFTSLDRIERPGRGRWVAGHSGATSRHSHLQAAAPLACIRAGADHRVNRRRASDRRRASGRRSTRCRSPLAGGPTSCSAYSSRRRSSPTPRSRRASVAAAAASDRPTAVVSSACAIC